jgi:glucosamine 6-phosphate synthetase-like amidotransferase/phosphosugar isomerase protein
MDMHLVHNGVIAAHQSHAQQMRLPLSSDCDSELLMRLIERCGNPVSGLNEAMQSLHGSMAVAVMDGEGVLYLARNTDRPLWLAELWDERRFFASTREIIMSAVEAILGDPSEHLRSLVPLAPYAVHQLMPEGQVVARDEILV